MIVSLEKCFHCGACVGACPQNVIYLSEVVPLFNEGCNHCARCIRVCPVGAIREEE